MGRFFRRFFLLLIVAALTAAGGLYLILGSIFDGPSPAAAARLCQHLMSDSKTAWIPGIYYDENQIDAILNPSQPEAEQTEPEVQDVPVKMEIPAGETVQEDIWADCPDGIYMEQVEGDSYKAFVMLIKDPSRVYLGISNPDGFSSRIPGKRVNEAMEAEGAAAAINSGAFYDNGTSDLAVGATPEGLVYSGGQCVWQNGVPPKRGFAGFNQENRLIVEKENIKKDRAEELGIRDGCCFGPWLIIDGEINQKAYDEKPEWNPRTAIGQKEDGTVIFLCIDGRQASSVGGTYADIIDIMQDFGAVNACNMDGGSSTVMMYRDFHGRYGEPGQTYMVNSYSQLQPYPRRMPDYWMVRPGSED